MIVKLRLQKLEIVTFPRPEHHAVLPESDWLGVAVNREVAHGEERHQKRLPTFPEAD